MSFFITARAKQSRERGLVQQHHPSDHAATWIWMCCHGNSLPLTQWWGCLVCQCDSCWFDVCVEDVYVHSVLVRLRYGEKGWTKYAKKKWENNRKTTRSWCKDSMITTRLFYIWRFWGTGTCMKGHCLYFCLHYWMITVIYYENKCGEQ